MAYATNTDVTNEFKDFDTTGLITTTKIDAYITETDAYIDGRVGGVYTTPITGTNSLLIIKNICIGLVAQRIANIMATKSIVPKGDQAIPINLIEEAEKKLDMIAERRLLLADAAEAATNVKSYSSDNTVTRVFKQGSDQW